MSYEDCEGAGHVRYCPDCEPDAFMCTTCELGARVTFGLIAEESSKTADLASFLEVSHELSAGGWLLRCEIHCKAQGRTDLRPAPGTAAERRALVRLAAAIAQRIEGLDQLTGDATGPTDGDDGPDARDFYILATTEIVGNCALWWCPDGKGYTCELEKAGLYTLAEASSHRRSDVPIHRSIAESVRVSHVRVDHLRPRVDGRLFFGPNGGLEQS